MDGSEDHENPPSSPTLVATAPAVIPDEDRGGEDLARHALRADAFRTQSRTANTRRAYRASFADYAGWCERLGLAPLSADPQLIGMYLAGLPERQFKYATIRMRLSAIAAAHRASGLALDLKDPRISRVMEGIARSLGTRSVGSKPVLADELASMLRALPTTPLGARDRALLIIGFGAAMRRTELVALDLSDVQVTDSGLKVLIRFSKTDQVGAGEEVGIHRSGDPKFCPVHALEAWLDIRGRQPGALFQQMTRTGNVRPERLSDRGVVRAVKAAAVAIGLDPARYAGHSLRAGLATSASNAGADLLHIMNQTRHRSVETVRRYVRDAEIWRNNVTRLVLPTEASPSMPAVPTRESAAKLLRNGLYEGLQRAAANYAMPIFWIHAEDRRPVLRENGTAFVLDAGEGPFLVTAAHVYRGFLRAKRAHPDAVCLIAEDRFPLDERLLHEDLAYDVATFRIEPAEIEALQRSGKYVLTGSQSEWPPKPPTLERGVFFVGFPGDLRQMRPYRGGGLVEVDWEGYTAIASATSISHAGITLAYDHDAEVDIGRRKLPPSEVDLGGCSGAPLLSFVEHRGVYSWRLGGVVYESGQTIVKAARADCLNPDGTINRFPDPMAYLTERSWAS